jgi:hypothetical protein
MQTQATFQECITLKTMVGMPDPLDDPLKDAPIIPGVLEVPIIPKMPVDASMDDEIYAPQLMTTLIIPLLPLLLIQPPDLKQQNVWISPSMR